MPIAALDGVAIVPIAELAELLRVCAFWWEARAQEQGQPLQPPAGLLSRYPA